MIRNANVNFPRALVDAATTARVQKHKQDKQQPCQSQFYSLTRKKVSLDNKSKPSGNQTNRQNQDSRWLGLINTRLIAMDDTNQRTKEKSLLTTSKMTRNPSGSMLTASESPETELVPSRFQVLNFSKTTLARWLKSWAININQSSPHHLNQQ